MRTGDMGGHRACVYDWEEQGAHFILFVKLHGGTGIGSANNAEYLIYMSTREIRIFLSFFCFTVHLRVL